MVSTIDPRPTRDGPGVNPNWVWRGWLLGAIAGALIAWGYLIAVCLADPGAWAGVPGAVLLAGPIGAIVGTADAAFALAVVALCRWGTRPSIGLTAVIAGLAAALVPLLITFHAGWPHADGGAAIGLGLSTAAFVAGTALTPLAFRPGTRL